MVGTNPFGLFGGLNAFLERTMPHGLYKRALIILIAPILLLQVLMVGIILERYYDNVTRVLGRNMARQVGFLLEQYERTDQSPEAFSALSQSAQKRLSVIMEILPDTALPATKPLPFYAVFERRLQGSVASQTTRRIWVDSNAPDERVEIRVEYQPQKILSFRFSNSRIRLDDTRFLLTLLLGATLLLLGIAMIFLRNQIKPIQDLAAAAKDFGMGRTNTNFKPRGATEVLDAGHAFVDMRHRIERHVEQRTTMLAGVSHDLRTILTRFKLELAVLGDNPKIHPLKEDVDEMQHMLEDYMAFVGGAGGEQTSPVSLQELVNATVETVERERPDTDAVVRVSAVPDGQVKLRPNAFRRLLINLVSNGVRYGHKVEVSGVTVQGRLFLHVDDDGPGIPLSEREDVFRPFVRLDNARNLDETGTGLGLAIARDIAQAHGGDIQLSDSPLGGLRATVNIPV